VVHEIQLQPHCIMESANGSLMIIINLHLQVSYLCQEPLVHECPKMTKTKEEDSTCWLMVYYCFGWCRRMYASVGVRGANNCAYSTNF